MKTSFLFVLLAAISACLAATKPSPTTSPTTSPSTRPATQPIQLRVACIEMGGIAGIVKPVFIIESQDFHSDDDAGGTVTRISSQQADAIIDLLRRSKFMQTPSGDKGPGMWNDTMFEELDVTLGAEQHDVFEPDAALTQKIRRIAGIKLPGE